MVTNNSNKRRKRAGSRGFDRFSTNNYRVYLVIMTLMALAGYAAILLFPLMTFFSGKNVVLALFAESIEWERVLILTLVMIISAIFTYRIVRTKPALPGGLNLQSNRAPQVQGIVERYQATYKRPVIDQIILTDEYDIDIIKTPRWMLPVWSHNTLMIGLPVMNALSPIHLEMMIARRLGQYSKKHNFLSNWLHQLNVIWPQYAEAYGRQKTLESKVLMFLCKVYSAIYSGMSSEVARQEELHADRYLQDLYNHQDVREFITMESVARYFLDNHFWPAFDKLVHSKPLASIKPFSSLPAVIRTNMTAARSEQMVTKILNGEYPEYLRIPSVGVRLENIGHDSPAVVQTTGHSAAEKLLGKFLPAAVGLMDMNWQKRIKAELAKQEARDKSFFRFLRPSLKEA